MLDSRIAFRLPIVFAGMMLATGRRTAASWFRVAGVKDDWDRFYDLLTSIGSSTSKLMVPLLVQAYKRLELNKQSVITLGLDDSPTQRFGRHVEAANIHHNPTPGPGDGDWLYGHNWVCLAMLMTHPGYGVVALPLLSMLYVRKTDIAALQDRYQWKFRTKHELALDLSLRIMDTLRAIGSKAVFVFVFDGAYAAKQLIRLLLERGAVVVTRLRSDAKLFDLPKVCPGKKGRPRKYDENRISLKLRAGRRDGWQTIRFPSRGVETEGRYKSFEATSEVFGGSIRVVLLALKDGNWAAYASSDTTMSVETILKTVSDRWSIEEHFHDVKEIWGAGQQQVRRLYSSIGCWHLCGWLYSMVELVCWEETSETLVDRSDRPWDNPDRRASHTDRRRRIAREMLRNAIYSDLLHDPEDTKTRARLEQLLALAV